MKRIITGVCTAIITAVLLTAAVSQAALADTVRRVQIAPYYTEIDYMSVYNPCVE